MHGKHYTFCPAVVWLLMALILAAGMFVAPANAEVVLDEVIDDAAVSSINYNLSGTYEAYPQPSKLSITNVENISLIDFGLVYFSKIYNNNALINANQTVVTFELSGQTVGNGFVTYYRDSELNGYITVSGKFTESLGTGNKMVDIKGPEGAKLGDSLDGLRVTSSTNLDKAVGRMDENQMGLTGGTSTPSRYAYTGDYTYNRMYPFWHRVIIANTTAISYDVSVIKSQLGIPYSSSVTISGASGEYLNRTGITDEYVNIGNQDLPISVDIKSVTGNYHFVYPPYTPTPTPSEDSGLTVYIKNSQTGALIANANVVIDALVDGDYYPVVNRTEPSGIFTITLQPTGGGKPNPDSYRLIVTADGYNNPIPEINFTVDEYKNYIHCLLDPILGGPADENKTFIDFFVRDMASNPISGATVKFGKYTLITNSAGYTVFEVDKNNNYSWTVSKSGYGALTGNAVIGNDPRHTINTVLAPIVTPTTTTPIPTSPPIGPTPTMTGPTGEPVSNWLEWFAAHFGMILGGGVEIGKIFMWLCFTVPVGVYVGKEAKAGAAGFMAGAGIVTLFFVLIGWVPIWLVVLLALIIGLLYAKEFNAPDNGGGR